MPSQRVKAFGSSIIREMTRLSLTYDCLNLSQGFPDFPAPAAIKEAAAAAVLTDVNQYTVTWGVPALREAIAEKARRFNGLDPDPATDVTVTCGAAEAMACALLSLVDPGDEVIIFEPFFETYVPDLRLCSGMPVYVELHEPHFRFDPDELRRAFSPRTRAIIVNTPHNPTGRVFDDRELGLITELCQEHGAVAITDEIYEYMTYDGRTHRSIASLPGMWENTITISGMSKTYSVTGWRLGYAIAPNALTEPLRNIHDYLTVCAPAPLQYAALAALSLPAEYELELLQAYTKRRAMFSEILERNGFDPVQPEGAYYTMAGYSRLGDEEPRAFVERMARDARVVAVPGSAFYRPGRGGKRIRFAFCKSPETMAEADRRLRALRVSAK
ncbi:MAG: aminotransferase class I/II-fold pyridoxal phosphate-dependent enzyme [Chloroflexi bacterium]|nr:aminotransferase class I/II-fold pyridoxal phosphate-dependent enzyme [Chloroflexota bacterium]